MKNAIGLLIFLFCVGCFKNSDSSMLGTGIVINPGDSEAFIAAKVVFSGSCGGGSCHNNDILLYSTEAQFIAAGFVTPGDADVSSIYCRLQGSTGSCGAKNMPQGQPALDSAEMQAISTWVNGMTP